MTRRPGPPRTERLIRDQVRPDGTTLCSPPDGCVTCQVVAGPREGEDWRAFLGRVRALWERET